MVRDKDRKRLIRNRMKKTGESYTAARAQVISRPKPKPAQTRAVDYPALAGMTDAAVAAKTGHTWQEWVRALDADEASTLPHRDIAQLVHGKHGVGDWWSQMVTVGYERIKGLRDRGQRRGGGYEASKSKTVGVPVDALFAAWADDRTRRRWLGAESVMRTATTPKSMRLQMPDGTIVALWFMAKGAAKSSVAVQQTKLRDKTAADAAKKYWSERLARLASLLGS
jgi:hypothetical protein